MKRKSDPRRRPLRLAAVVAMAASTACSKGSIEGNVRVMLPEGSLLPAAQAPVGLAAEGRTLRKAMERVCDGYQTQRKALLTRHRLTHIFDPLDINDTTTDADLRGPIVPAAEVSAVLDTVAQLDRAMRASVDSAVDQSSGAKGMTDNAGHYQFLNVPTGDYVLWTRLELPPHPIRWWQVVHVRRGTDTVDLDTRAAREGKKQYCTLK